MKRRQFCKATLAAGVTASLPSFASDLEDDLPAVTVDGDDIVIEKAAALELRDSLHGYLLVPTSDGYEAARKVWNGMIDRRPAMIARCTSEADVARAVTFAAERNLLLSVKGGGHSYPGKCIAENGLMIDLSGMSRVRVDPISMKATAQGGALLGQLDGAALQHDLITTTGVVSHTGVGGFTTGGGMGRTDRVHGYAVDNVLGARMVTPDGKIVSVGPNENSDLYWGIRGGGGNFGVVTEFAYKLHPFAKEIYGGGIEYPWSEAKNVLTYWAEINDTLPDGASFEPYLYPDDEGGRGLYVQLYFTGPPAEGEKVFTKLAKFGKPIAVNLGMQSYTEVQTMFDESTAHGKLNYIKSGLLPELTPAAIDAIVDSLSEYVLPSCWFQHLGGASARVDPEATAYPHRRMFGNFGIDRVWTNPDMSERYISECRAIYAAIEPHTQGFYSNLHDDTESKTMRNFGVNYDRLVELKTQYDPANLFRLNANVKPKRDVSQLSS